MALAAYRHLLRSINIAFLGDARMLTAARFQARTNFEQNRALLSDGEELANSITHAEEVAKLLRENVVQGKAIENEEGRYKLRIHEHTERGDNEDIKKGGNGNTLAGVKCCSS